ncbi:MAG: M13 family metallopeptidase [Bacteroidota bacterium]|nr:M13 family metallopeptidase [Bacteroidota bacterium]
MKKIFLYSLICASIFSCTNKTTETSKDVFAANIDTATNPAQDYFSYANGKWIKDNPIPNEESSWGIANLVVNENLQRLRNISEQAAKDNGAKGSASQKIGDFWTAAMDSAKIEQQGTKYLQPYFEKINTITDLPSFVSVVSELDKIGVNALFNDYVAQDDKNSEAMSFKLDQGGLGLPEREYYFNTDSSTTNIRKAYVNHIAKMLVLQGQDSTSSAQSATNILTMETKLAKASRKLADLRDPYANYHKMAIADLNKLSSSIDWKNLLKNIGVTKIDSVIVGQPEFFKSLNDVLKITSINDWKNYLRYRTLSSFTNALPDAFVKETFNFRKLFTGAKEMKPRWKRAIASEENSMGELLGQLYVKKYFDSTTKKRYSDLVENIRDAYKDRIKNLTWMSDSTKQKALVKLAAMNKKVGYPDKWKDFSAMEISKESYVQNLINANKWWHNYEMNKLGKPIDKTEWDMFPQTYNAYYNPNNNEIVLPAGIFTVPGFKDSQLDDAVVYGYAGASTIGHEITHGFDDQGRLYDEKGNLKNWWSKNDSAEFAKRSHLMVEQFNGYEPLPGTKINGAATLGENIADLGGILLGIDAFKKTEEYKKNVKVDGQTPMQRFFMGYALGWLYSVRDQSLKSQLMTDVHSPAEYRVNGPFSDVDEFYSTYNVKPGKKMYRPDSLRVKIW